MQVSKVPFITTKVCACVSTMLPFASSSSSSSFYFNIYKKLKYSSHPTIAKLIELGGRLWMRGSGPTCKNGFSSR